ncbi:MAG TPA: glycine cleavage T C-terminal barrel domain-containing protein [Acidimicrobiales bacterium]|nr:glycine cleavage T C-terminal barrel domain-containing protein [Acidimicrobiales bacterium]
MADLTADYLALRREVGAVWLARDVLRLHGPDTITYLQGQLSQDVEALAVGDSALSFLLQPQGKVDALVRVTRTGDDEVVVDVDGGWGEAVNTRLTRFKLRSKFEIEALDWKCIALRGPQAHDIATTGLAVDADWPGLPGVDLLGPDPQVPDGVRVCDHDAYRAVRIEAGVPEMGAELDERTIPQEAGIADRAVSFTKGCYTGQELVARLDARGNNVPRHLRGIVVATNVVPPVHASLERDGKVVGALTSVGESLDRHAPVALAYVSRAVEPGDDVTVTWDGGSAAARVESLPLVST